MASSAVIATVVDPKVLDATVVEPNVVSKQPGGAQQMPTTIDELLAGDGAMVKQLTNECCRFLCCQPNIRKISLSLLPVASSAFNRTAVRVSCVP